MPRPRRPARPGLVKPSASQNPAAPSASGRARDRTNDGLDQFSTRLPAGMKRALKVLAVQTDQGVQDIVAASLERTLASHGLWPPAP
jgi:hypothetical protein